MHRMSNASDMTMMPIVMLTFGVLLFCVTACAVFFYYKNQFKIKRLSLQLRAREDELANAVSELKALQLRLIESGKVSAAAALSAGVLHQISQPVTAIHGFVRFMKQEMPPDNTFYRPVCLMDEQSVYLKEMLDNLMVVIRHRKIEKMSIDVNSVVDRSLSLLADELRIRRVHWETGFTRPMPQVLADPVHLQQVFMNILINACDALSTLPPGKERTLRVLTTFDSIGRTVKVQVIDNGPGIPEDIKEHIFEPFFSTKTTGTGIGLALCHDLVREHGGTIEVGSSVSGTRFTVSLPVETFA